MDAVWISLILYTDIKTCPVFTSTPEADTILWQQHWPGISCNLLLQLLFLSKTCTCGLAYMLFFTWAF